jgi:hypothetical protein
MFFTFNNSVNLSSCIDVVIYGCNIPSRVQCDDSDIFKCHMTMIDEVDSDKCESDYSPW